MGKWDEAPPPVPLHINIWNKDWEVGNMDSLKTDILRT